MLPRIFLPLAALIGMVLPSAAAPNILFILADDQAYETVGHDGIETPNLDRLAARGTQFTHAYNMGGWNGAICVASRHMFITGLSLWRAEEASKKLDAEYRDKGLLWPQLLAASGYRTYVTGKWHINTDPATCFDMARHKRPGMPKQTKAGYNRPPADGSPDPWSPYDKSFGGFWEGGKHWSEIVADDGIDFINDAADHSDPFFAYVAFNAPHDPRQSPKEYVDRYPLDSIEVPADFVPEYPYAEAMKAGKSLRDEKLAPFPRTEHSIKVNRQEYFAIITHMDHEIGRILDALEESGQADDTVIIFTADHGLSVGHHGLLGKQNQFDHSIRSPFLIAGPGIPAGKTIDAPIYIQDTVPTTLEMAGAPVPAHVEFHSLVPFLTGKRTESYYPAVYSAYLAGAQRSITADGHKLIIYPAAEKTLLFDLAKDPLEMAPIDDAATTTKLLSSLEKLQERYADPLDLSKLKTAN